MHDLGTFGGTYSYGWAINAIGQVTGLAATAGNAGQHAFLYDGSMHDLGTLGGTESRGLDINLFGQVTGCSWTAGNATTHAFIYDAANGIVDLNSLIDPMSGWVLWDAEGINDAGQITGQGRIGGQYDAFLAHARARPRAVHVRAGRMRSCRIGFWVWHAPFRDSGYESCTPNAVQQASPGHRRHRPWL